MKTFSDSEADLAELAGRTIGIVGYGNQGRAQAQNMRDSGLSVLVGSPRDASYERARQDSFEVVDIAGVARRADVICLLIPDEVQRTVYTEALASELRPGQMLSFAHGYNIRFRHIVPPPTVDVGMVAPRMIGTGVRSSFLAGKWVPATVAVWQDATGRALARTLALAKAIGATVQPVLETTFAAEAEIDLFMEQAVWASVVQVFRTAFEVLTQAGYAPEEALLEMYVSGEAAEVFAQMRQMGFFKQMALHSRTSQYGQLTRSRSVLPGDLTQSFAHVLEAIRDGSFDQEWSEEARRGYPLFDDLRRNAEAHPMNTVESQLALLIGSQPTAIET
ncbi:MAG: ketol-acid reductoisomerase [Anaerolineales bacterium]|nr:ketol-acid reductoisomerase [Anaerolineales bacterium]